MSLLTDEERAKLIEECRNQDLDIMFGDGQEEEYVMQGFPEHKGLLNMTDEELLEDYGHYNPDVHTTPELRVQALREEWAEE